jgi:hypothetical protein
MKELQRQLPLPPPLKKLDEATIRRIVREELNRKPGKEESLIRSGVGYKYASESP